VSPSQLTQFLCRLGIHRWSRWGSAFIQCRTHYDYINSNVAEVCQRWCQRCNMRSEKTLRRFSGPCLTCPSRYSPERATKERKSP
jgi:hypothetical protein